MRETAFTPRWTLKRFVSWIKQDFGISCCRETVRKTLKTLGFSWKKYRKLLNKASPEKRAEFVDTLSGLLQEATEGERQIIYIDEAHIQLDTDEGYGWSVLGKRGILFKFTGKELSIKKMLQNRSVCNSVFI